MNEPCSCGSGKKYKQCCYGKAPAQAANKTIKAGLQHHQAGRLQQAEALYRQVLQSQPDHPDALHLLGWVAHQVGRGDAAVELVGKAISVSPFNPVYYGDLGNMLHTLGDLDAAVENYQKALKLDPDSVEVQYNLGNALLARGKPEEAAARFRKVLAQKPDAPEAHNNLGNALRAHGRLDEAIECYRRALSLKPDFADVHQNLGFALQALGNADAAIGSFRAAVALRPDVAELHYCLGSVLFEHGELYTAVDAFMRALDIRETPEARSAFAAGIGPLRFIEDNPDVRRLLARAIAEPWARPADLAGVCVSLIKCEQTVRGCVERATSAWPARLSDQQLYGPSGFFAVAADQLLRALLENTPACDAELERFLTMARLAMLKAAAAADAADAPQVSQLEFYCALARQCHINEYVFDFSDEEIDQANQLRGQLASALASAAPFPVLWLPAVASYFPLSGLASVDAAMEKAWPDAVAGLLAQQVRECRQEESYRAAMPHLTAADAHVPRDEDGPYPRWEKLPPGREPMTVDTYLRVHFPTASFKPLGKTDAVDILVAGCATGEYAIEVAQHLSGARVLAVDAGTANLAYAKRKAVECGVNNIEFARADILKLASTGRQFDLVDSVGALHYLPDPRVGLLEMLSVLRPGGLMRVVLLSECSRQSVNALRGYVAEHRYAGNDADLRRCRQDLMTTANSLRFGKIMSSAELFDMSGCRELFFRGGENRYNLFKVMELLDQLSLDFIGFILEPRLLRKYAARFPDDKSMNSLECWNIFETENPDAFPAMYRFFAQKRE